MKATTILLACSTCWWTAVVPLGAQPATPQPPARFDMHASLGWAHVQRGDLASYDDWDHAIAHGAVGVGWYWTDHLKTEVELGANTGAEFYAFERFESSNRTAYQSSRIHLRTAGIGVAQLYQFFRNAWVHPYVGTGIDVRREAVDEDIDAVVVYDTTSRESQVLTPARHLKPHASFHARPFAMSGVKAYLSERAFFRADVRARLGTRSHEVIARAGFGVDF